MTLFNLFNASPFYGDIAYFTFFSKLVGDGVPIYASSTFGYTPLSVIIPGIALSFLEDIGIHQMTIMKLFGIMNFSILIYFMFRLSTHYFGSRIAVMLIILTTGFGLVAENSVNALDPKLLVATLTVAGFYFLVKQKFFLAAMLFSFCFWTWQPAAINLIFLGVYILLKRTHNQWLYVFAGFVVASLPCFIYLLLSSQVVDFFDQAIINRLTLGASSSPFIPFAFLYTSLKHYPTEIPIFLASLTGFGIAVKYLSIIKGEMRPLFILTLFWAILLSKEYGARDLLPILPLFILWSGYFIKWLIDQKRIDYRLIVLCVSLFVYFDLFLPRERLKEQLKLHDAMTQTYDFQKGSFIAIGPKSEGFLALHNAYSHDYLIRFNKTNMSLKSCDELISDFGSSVTYAVVDSDIQYRDSNFDCGNELLITLQKLKPVEFGELLVYELKEN